MYKSLTIAASFMLSVSVASAESWDLSNEYPATSLTGIVADKFAELVEQNTDGAVEVTVHHGGALGFKSVDHFDAVSEGALQIALSPYSFWAGIDPIFSLVALPFVAPSPADARRLLEIARPEYEAVLESANQLMLVGAPYPSSGIWGNKPFDSMDAFKGTKIRTYDVASTETLRNTGALPLQLSWADVPAQLSTNAVEAVLTGANGGIGIQLWEMQSHFTEVNFGAALFAIHVNRDIFEDLEQTTQEGIMEAALEAENYGWDLVSQLTDDDYQTMRDEGMTIVTDLPESVRDELKAAGQPFIEDWMERVGERATKVLDVYNAQ